MDFKDVNMGQVNSRLMVKKILALDDQNKKQRNKNLLSFDQLLIKKLKEQEDNNL